MASVRAPGDISPKERYQKMQYRYAPAVYRAKGDYTPTPYGNWNITDQLVHRSVRPTFDYGVRIALGDGKVFVKSTNYKHESQTIYLNEYPYECSYFTDGSTSTVHKALQDSGREVGQLILQRSKFLVFNTTVNVGAKNEAVTKCLTKIADQKVNLGEALATLHQTANMFFEKSLQIYSLHMIAKNSKGWKDFFGVTIDEIRRAGPLKSSAREYLAFIYGFKPLYDDLHTLHEELKKNAQSVLLLKAVGTGTRIQAPSKKVTRFSNSIIHVLGGEAKTTTKCTIWAQLDPDHPTWRTLNQFGLSNPFGLAWDLIPYSFVVDWFVPVGPVLYAMSAPMGLKFWDGSISTRTTENILTHYKGKGNQIDYDTGPRSGPQFEMNKPVTLNHEYYHRDKLTTWPLPGLYVDPNPFRADRSLKALALGIIGLSGSRSPVR